MTAGRVKIRFFASQYVAKAAVTDVKTPTGTMRVSTPETTAIDLVRFRQGRWLCGQRGHGVLGARRLAGSQETADCRATG